MNIMRSTGSMLNCFRMATPLSITEDEIDIALEIIDESLTAVLAAHPAQLNL
jgi:4-aminobutyrate aminotransferase-like enzyme